MWKMTLTIAVLAALVFPREAQAYLDPGTGSALLQMAIAGIMGGLFIIKMYWRRLMALFSGKTLDDETEAKSTSTPPDDQND